MRPAQLLNQPVIASAAAHGQPVVGDKFEHGAGVIVESAHDVRIDGERQLRRRKTILDRLKMVAAVVAKIIEYHRRVRRDGGAGRGFAIENTHRVALQPIAAGLAKVVPSVGKISL